jgi:hypothetical protein
MYFFGDRNNQPQVGLHHLFLGSAPQHQATAEFDVGHFNKGSPFLVVGVVTVITIELLCQFL